VFTSKYPLLGGTLKLGLRTVAFRLVMRIRVYFHFKAVFVQHTKTCLVNFTAVTCTSFIINYYFLIGGRGSLPNRSRDQHDILHSGRAWSGLDDVIQFWGIQH